MQLLTRAVRPAIYLLTAGLVEALRVRRLAVSRENTVRAWVVWPFFALTCGVAYRAHFLISHHRH